MASLGNMKNTLRRYVKWGLLVFCFFAIILNYYAFVQMIDALVLNKLDPFMVSRGYYFSLKDPIDLFLDGLVPLTPIIDYAIHVKDRWKNVQILYEKITIIQLLLYSILLPVLLYSQNLFYKKLFFNPKDNGNV